VSGPTESWGPRDLFPNLLELANFGRHQTPKAVERALPKPCRSAFPFWPVTARLRKRTRNRSVFRKRSAKISASYRAQKSDDRELPLLRATASGYAPALNNHREMQLLILAEAAMLGNALARRRERPS